MRLVEYRWRRWWWWWWFQSSTPPAFGLTCGYSLSISGSINFSTIIKVTRNVQSFMTFFYTQITSLYCFTGPSHEIYSFLCVTVGGFTSSTLLLQTALFVAHPSISPALNSWISGIPSKYAEPFANCDHIRIVRFPLIYKMSEVRFFLSSNIDQCDVEPVVWHD